MQINYVFNINLSCKDIQMSERIDHIDYELIVVRHKSYPRFRINAHIAQIG